MVLNLHNCDCMEIMRQMPDKHCDLALVDPPYGIGESRGANNSRNAKSGFKRKSGEAIASTKFEVKDWDNKVPDSEYFDELFRVSRHQVIFGANHFIDRFAKNASCWIVWDKLNGNSHFSDCELAWTSFPTAVRKLSFRWNGMLQGNMRQKETRIHPTQKPVALYYAILEKWCKPGIRVLDTHLGSGSSAIAASQFGAGEFIGCELESDYFKAASERISLSLTQTRLF